MFTWKRVLILIIILAAAGFFYYRNWSSQQSLAEIETAEAEVTTLRESITATGRTRAKKEALLHFQTGGRLAYVNVALGDSVTAHQSIAGLDTRETQKNLQKSLRDFSKEYNDWLEDKNVTYQHEVHDNVMSDTVKRILEKNQWDLDKAVMDVELKDLAIKLSSLVSPIEGIVTRIDTPVAGVNASITDTVTITDPGSILFTANVDELDIGKITAGQEAAIALDAYPDTDYPGTVGFIAFSSELSSSGGTVFPVDISFMSAPVNIRGGLNGDMTITTRTSENAITVPLSAMREKDGEKFVIRKTDDGFEKMNVTTGITEGNSVEITSGLKKGDVVVVKGFQHLPKELQNGS